MSAVDPLAQIEARLEEHRKEVRRLETARDVLMEILGKPKTAASAGISVRRIATDAPEAKAKKAKPKKAKHKDNGKLGRLGDFAIQLLTILRDNPGSTSDDMAHKMGAGEHAEDRKRIYNNLYTLKLRGDVVKEGLKFTISSQGMTTIAEAKMLATIESQQPVVEPPPQEQEQPQESVAA